MLFGILRPVHFILCAAVMLCGAQVAIEDCRFANGHLGCTYPAATYHIRLPEERPPGLRTPVVVLLHDAGRSAASVLENEPLIRSYRDAGYALVVPVALPRKNRRIEYYIAGDRYSMRREGFFENLPVLPADFSKKKYYLETPDGGKRLLDFDVDRGWYFYNTDQVIYRDPLEIPTEDDLQYEYIGRDEIGTLSEILAYAANKHGTSERPSLILGFGHGGSLVWQIACHAPDFADLLAPVGGAFWGWLPDRCEPGAWLLHTHERASEFWPLSGAKGSEFRYSRTSIYENVDLLLKDNWCSGAPMTARLGGSSARLRTWDDCVEGGPVELLVLDGRFAFQDWWLDELLNRIGPVRVAPPVGPPVGQVEPDSPKPVFKRPGSDNGSLFKRPKTPDTN